MQQAFDDFDDQTTDPFLDDDLTSDEDPYDAPLLADLQGKFEGVPVMVLETKYQETRAGKPYTRMTVKDSSAKMPAVCWDGEINRNGDVVAVISGSTDEYQGQRQIKLASFKPVSAPSTGLKQRLGLDGPHDIAKMRRDLHRLQVKEMTPDHWALWSYALDSASEVPPWSDEHPFWWMPAAVSHHHAYRGGLAYHTLTMFNIARSIESLGAYNINWPAVKTAILCHDLGKLDTYTPTNVHVEVLEDEKWAGHTLRSILRIREATRVIKHLNGSGATDAQALPADELRLIEHCIAAHHGNLEWGAIAVPQTPEAWVIHLIDMIDSRVQGMIEQ